MNIVIFGGNGFIGRHLHKLLKKRHLVTVYGNKTFSDKLKSSYIKYSKKNFLEIIKKKKPEIIFFLSGNSYPINTLENELYDFNSNNLILQQLLSAMVLTEFKGRIIYSSSIAVYGTVSANKNVVDETDNLNPLSYYGLSKSIAEQQIKFFCSKYNLRAIVLRICSVYGPGLNRQIIYELIKKLLEKKGTIYLQGNFEDSRQFIYVSDCVKIMQRLIKFNIRENFSIYNLAQGKKISINKISYIINSLLRKKTKIYFTNKIIQPNLPKLCNKKVKKLLGIKYFVNIEKGLKKTIKFLQKNNA
jgi:nucleoside-diphosphate-sugar epimerase